jgi:hypothetical protein
VDYLYSLYDALTSINVPADKARAVIDAMERDMGTNLATKSDLELLRAEVRQESALLRKDFEVLATGLRKDLETMATSLRKDNETLAATFRKEHETLAAAVRKDMDLLSSTMTVRLGSMQIVGLSLLFAALKLA